MINIENGKRIAQRFAKTPVGRRVLPITAGIVATTLSLTGCYGHLEGLAPIATPTTSTASGEPNKTIINNYTTTITASSAPEAPISYDLEIEVGNGNKVRVKNVKRSVPDSTVDTAKGQFINTIGGGTEMAVAEPGGLLVGSDFGSKSDINPYGNNPAGWDAMYNSKGAIQVFSPDTQAILRTKGPEFVNLPEGGFALATFAKAKVKIGNIILDIPAIDNNNYMLIVRGKYGDNKQNTDNNLTMEFSDYFPGNAQVLRYPASRDTNTAFISEGQFKQIAMASHSQGNSGDGGASKLTVLMLDTNSGALVALQQNKGRFEDPSTGWQSLFKNFNARPTR